MQETVPIRKSHMVQVTWIVMMIFLTVFHWISLCCVVVSSISSLISLSPSEAVNERLANIKAFLQPLKDKNVDGKWPTSQSQMEQLYIQWSGRRRHQLVLEKCVLDAFDEWLCEKEMKHNDKGETE